jgi:hypothetical protein
MSATVRTIHIGKQSVSIFCIARWLLNAELSVHMVLLVLEQTCNINQSILIHWKINKIYFIGSHPCTFQYKPLNNRFRDNDKDYSATGCRNLLNRNKQTQTYNQPHKIQSFPTLHSNTLEQLSTRKKKRNKHYTCVRHFQPGTWLHQAFTRGGILKLPTRGSKLPTRGMCI